MAPALRPADLIALRAVNDALLDPLGYPDIDAWLLEVCARFEKLCQADTAMSVYAFADGRSAVVSRHLPRNYLDRVSELSLPQSGRIQGGDGVEVIMEGLRRRVSSVATTADLIAAAGTAEELNEVPMYRDVAFPLGIPGSALLFHSGASGEFMIHAAYPEPERVPFGDATRQILSVLLPGLAAGFGALARLGNVRQAVAVLIDSLEDGAVVYDSSCHKVLARNAAMSVLLQEEPNRIALEERIFQGVLAAARQSERTGEPPSAPATHPLSGGWRSRSGAMYRLRTVRLPAGCMMKGEAILVLVQRVGPRIPEPRELMFRFGFTSREAEVASRLAYGRSDREIAAELHLSPHTVRHHAESVFLKAGVTSRKALALHLS